MASFQKRNNGKWQYTISRMIDGKSSPIRKSGFTTKGEAQSAAREVESKLANGGFSSKENITLPQYFKEWVQLYKKNKVTTTTLEHYNYTLKMLDEYFQNANIQNIKRHEYQRFLNWLGQNKAKETVAKIQGHIKACVKDAMEDQLITIDFTRKTEISWANAAKKGEAKHLNFEESERLAQALQDKLKDGLGYSVLLLGLASGLRYGELVGLTKKDFDFASSTISVNKTWAYKRLTGSGFAPTKNDQSKRTIIIDPVTMQHFKELFEHIPNNIHQLVFYSLDSKYQVISNTNVNKLLKKTLLELNIEPITIHGLRHTHASVLLYKGNSIHYVSERLGHGDIETTLKEYTHILKEGRFKEDQLAINVFETMYKEAAKA